MTEQNDYYVVLTTCGSRTEAETLARHLVSERLAACVQLSAIDSVYMWDGEVNEEAETLLIIKTRGDLFPQLEAAIKEIHSYDVPEIVQLPLVAGSVDYLRWIDQVTG